MHAGGHLEANDLTITGVHAIGAEAHGEGSCLSLKNCEMHDFSLEVAEEEPDAEGAEWRYWSGSEDDIPSPVVDRCTKKAVARSWGVPEKSTGVRVVGSAAATLLDCQVSECTDACVCVMKSSCHLTSCTFSDADTGLDVSRQGSSAHATKCHLLGNRKGASANFGATLTAVSCTSSGNTDEGFCALHGNSVELQTVSATRTAGA